VHIYKEKHSTFLEVHLRAGTYAVQLAQNLYVCSAMVAVIGILGTVGRASIPMIPMTREDTVAYLNDVVRMARRA
jgi:hypothetical protein